MQSVAQDGLACLFVVFDGCHIGVCQTTKVILAELIIHNDNNKT